MEDDEKFWRITDESIFKEKAVNYIDHHVNFIYDNLENPEVAIFKNEDLKKKIRDNIRIYDRVFDNSKDNDEIIKMGLSIVLEDIKNWSNFSRDTDSPLDKIMLRAIIDAVYQCKYLCLAYVSANPLLPEEFIEDLIYVSSPYFRFSEWDNEHVKAVTESIAYKEKPNESERLLALYDIDRLGAAVVPMRLDMRALYSLNKSEEFKEKYKEFLLLINPDEEEDE